MDICSGTGEMAFYLSRLAPERTQVFAVDFALPMVDQALKKKDSHKIFFILSDINVLPFPDKTFDLVTISFATRNINLNRERLLQSLQEIKRILKPKGRFVSLETSQPSSSLIRKLFHIYVRLAVKPIGQIISGSKSAYSYLSHTIPRFYSTEEFAEILLQAGFAQVTFERMLFGVTAVHTAVK